MECILRLPYPPSNNHYKKLGGARDRGTGKLTRTFYLTPETSRYHREVYFLFRMQKGLHLKSKKIRMEIDVFPPDKRKRDLDNILKVLNDSLQKAGAFEDDFYIQELLLIRREIIPGGEIVVKLMEL